MRAPTHHVGLASRVGVMRNGRNYRLVATEPIPTAAHLFPIEGALTEVPTRYSVQVSDDVHIDLPTGFTPEEILDQFFWRFMNHSCEPSAAIRSRWVVSLRPIAPGQEITFHYNTTEYSIIEPFDCQCGSKRCEGRIQGFQHLSATDREQLRPWLSDHLHALANRELQDRAKMVKA